MIEGHHIIGFEQSAKGDTYFSSINPATDTKLDYRFCNVTSGEIDQALSKAADAFTSFRKKSGQERALFLEAIAAEIMALGGELITCCNLETALPAARLEGERSRTVNQANLFATLLKEGSWVEARIDTALPQRQPLPRPDIRSVQVALGPVVVFGASNFPLAFSVAGGDTVAALAAGCPVVCKAHPAHPATSELVAKAIQRAAMKTNMPDGVFSLLFTNEIPKSIELVTHPSVKAVAFTGSFAAGKALFDAAAKRDEPIPVYAEMGSSNPVFVLPDALAQYGEMIASSYADSLTLGAGQFCTNPGMLIYETSQGTEVFDEKLKDAISLSKGGVMLTRGIHENYEKGIKKRLSDGDVTVIAEAVANDNVNFANPVLFKTDAARLKANPHLSEELFGPASLVVEATSKSEVLAIAKDLSGHLTATVHGSERDLLEYRDLLDILEEKVGRIVINGFPTGVEVCHAMVHGGPYPATTDARSTSVGTSSIKRFTRPVCYQNMPGKLLPGELKNENKLNLWRLVNGEQTKDAVD